MTLNKFYVTKEGLGRLEKDYKRLLEFKRSKIRGEVPSILHSEEANPEYLAFQEDMSLLEARLAEYENILQNTELIQPPEKKAQRTVQLGAVVTLDFGGMIDEFMIVGTIEADPAQKRISNESPIGKALLGSKVGDTVSPNASIVEQKCKVLKIRYS